MAQTCTLCHRTNPTGALYCYHDGTALAGAGAGGPVNAGTQAFLSPFVFSSGVVCRNFDQLALACQNHWGVAGALLQKGYLENFLGSIGRADLALAAHEAAQFPDGDRALDQFLGRLPTSVLEPPRLHVEPREVNIGHVQVGEDRRLDVHLVNRGMRLLYGFASSDCAWLGLGDGAGAQRKLVELSAEQTITLYVRGKHLRAGHQPIEGRLVIDTNGGTATVLVRAEVPVKPFSEGVLAGAFSPRQVAERAKADPQKAGPLFESGAVARWYEANGWTYPVQGPPASGLGAVQQFFEALGLTSPPHIELRERQVFFVGNPGQRLVHRLEVKAREQRPVFAHGSSNQPWLEVGRPVLHGRTATLPLVISSVPGRPGETLEARVTVTANGNRQFVVPVALAVGGSRRAPLRTAVSILDEKSDEIPVVTAVGDGDEILDVLPARAGEPFGVRAAPPVRRPLPRRPAPAKVPDPAGKTTRPWMSLLPLALIVTGLLGVLARDCFVQGSLHPSAPEGPDVLDRNPRIAVRFHDREMEVTLGQTGVKPDLGQMDLRTTRAVWEASMRFGLVMLNERDARSPGRPKRLTFEEKGLTNNTCVRLDGHEWLFGERPFRRSDGRELDTWPGRWLRQEAELGQDSTGRKRDGRESVWVYDEQQVLVTQVVELVPGEQSRALDTCLVRYVMENRDRRPHLVGLRFLLDTYIGANDGVPFTIPGAKRLCDTRLEFNHASDVPDFIQALERDDLAHPGTVAHLQLKLGGRIEPPDRVTLGAWPNPRLAGLDPRCEQEKTLWEVPVLPIKSLPPGDSAVTIYWNQRPLQPGESREVGFAYGLGTVSGAEGHGQLALTAGGSFTPGGQFTLTAYVSNPASSQTLALDLPAGFTLLDGGAVQAVPPVSPNASSRNSPVTWKVRAGPSGRYQLRVRSSTGVAQTHVVTIRERRIFE